MRQRTSTSFPMTSMRQKPLVFSRANLQWESCLQLVDVVPLGNHFALWSALISESTCGMRDLNWGGWTEIRLNCILELVPSCRSRRRHVGVACLDGKLYAVGGHDGNQHLNTVECYDPKVNASLSLSIFSLWLLFTCPPFLLCVYMLPWNHSKVDLSEFTEHNCLC